MSHARKNIKKHDERGFTLVEAIVAATIFLLVMTMVTYVIKQTTAGYGYATQRTDAAILANNDMATAFTNNCGMETGANSTSSTITSPVVSATLSGGLSSGTSYSSIPIISLPAPLTMGTSFTLISGSKNQIVTISASASAGSTALSTNSFIASYSYPAGSTINTPSQTGYQPGVISQASILSNCGSLYGESSDTTLGDPLPYTTDYNSYIYQVSYTSAWTSGTNGSYGMCPSGSTSVNPVGQMRNLLVTWGPSIATLSNPLTKGLLYSSMSVTATSAPVAAGTTLKISTNGSNAQSVTVKEAAQIGSTTISLLPFQSASNYTGAQIIIPSSSFPGPSQWSSVLSSSVSNGQTGVTSLLVNPIPVPLSSNSSIYLVSSSGASQKVTLSNDAISGATSISVNSFTASASYDHGSAFISLVSQQNSLSPFSTFASIPTSQVIYNNATDGQIVVTNMAIGSYVTVAMPGWSTIRRFASPGNSGSSGGCAWFPFLPPNSQNPNVPSGPTVTYYSSIGASGTVVSPGTVVLTGVLTTVAIP